MYEMYQFSITISFDSGIKEFKKNLVLLNFSPLKGAAVVVGDNYGTTRRPTSSSSSLTLPTLHGFHPSRQETRSDFGDR
ncbi:hypothetical protein L2E82_35936 [Cichorium intybus]|uniref:Uncharacterized protein n=1 Tax=Cichorium intybus TaxID=13427 RepID=A0ACB9BQ45_CICIN|nr:hypothetical protein L2E82_35936 [Cichorium intybus]